MKKICIITCMYGRHELADKVLYYYESLKIDLFPKIQLINIVVGSENQKSKEIAENNNWEYHEYPNNPLSEKFNYALLKAKKHNPDGVVLIGSDDIISKGVFDKIYLNANISLGFKDCYIYSSESNEIIYWSGYKNKERKSETVGVGRYFCKDDLNKLNWSLWHTKTPIDRGLDSLCNKNLKQNDIKIKSYNLKNIEEWILDIKNKDNITKFNELKAVCQIVPEDSLLFNFLKQFYLPVFRNCFVSKSVEFFGNRFCERWQLIKSVDKDKPLVIFGCYNKTETDLALIHSQNQPVLIIWAGSDSMRDNVVSQFKYKQNIYHTTGSRWCYEDLKKNGIEQTYIPITVLDGKINELSPIPLGDKIYIYTSVTNPNFYGKPIYDKLIQKYGEKNFIIAHAKRFNRQQLLKAYSQCFIGLRLLEHDGISETVVELGLLGRNVVHNGVEPNSLNYNNYDDIINLIEEEKKNIGKTNYFISEKVKNHVNIGRNWLYLDFWTNKNNFLTNNQIFMAKVKAKTKVKKTESKNPVKPINSKKEVEVKKANIKPKKEKVINTKVIIDKKEEVIIVPKNLKNEEFLKESTSGVEQKKPCLKIIWRVTSAEHAIKAINSLETQTDKRFYALFVTNNKDASQVLQKSNYKHIYFDTKYPNMLYNSGLSDNSQYCDKVWLLDSGMVLFNKQTIELINSELKMDENSKYRMVAKAKEIESACCFVFDNKVANIVFEQQFGCGEKILNKLKSIKHSVKNQFIASL